MTAAMRELFRAQGRASVQFLCSGSGSRNPVRKRPVLGKDVAIELGKPGQAAALIVLPVSCSDIGAQRLTVLSPDWDTLAAGTSLSLGLVLLVASCHPEQPDLSALRSAASRMDTLEGVCIRALGSRLWIRISRQARQRGLGIGELAQAIFAACKEVTGVDAMEIMIACGYDELVQQLEAVALGVEDDIHRQARQRWQNMVSSECGEMDCRSCEEQVVCNPIRELLARRHKQGNLYV